MLMAVWRQLKVWRRIQLGPVGLFVSFRRVPVTTQGTWRYADYVPTELTGGRQRNENAAKKDISISPQGAVGTAAIVGVGTGFGYAVAKRLAQAGFDIALLTRNADRLHPLCDELRAFNVRAESYGLDATHETDVSAAFDKVFAQLGYPSLVIYSLQEFGPGSVFDVTVPAFESAWRHNCLGAFLVARKVGRAMKARGKGSIFFVGSTSSIIGRGGHLNLAVGKFGQRALAQVLSRELWPHGIHVAHVLIDADVRRPDMPSAEMVQSDPDDIAVSILALHNQPRSAWSSEIDLRPWNESFWEHC